MAVNNIISRLILTRALGSSWALCDSYLDRSRMVFFSVQRLTAIIVTIVGYTLLTN